MFPTAVNCAGLGTQESCEQSTVVFMWPEWGWGTCAGQKTFEAFCVRVSVQVLGEVRGWITLEFSSCFGTDFCGKKAAAPLRLINAPL